MEQLGEQIGKLDEVISHFGGVSATAKKLDVVQPAVSNWRHRGIPLDKAVRIETLTKGRFKAKELCPKAYAA